MKSHLLLGAGLLCGCLEETSTSSSLPEPRVIAVLASPAEARPDEPVRYELVVAGPDGPIVGSTRWAFCRTARPPDENAAVSEACANNDETTALQAELLETQLPADACARFGPETSAGLRPFDADLTGGYYQPLRILVPGAQTAVFRHRVRCSLRNAPLMLALRFAEQYRDNQAPTIRSLEMTTRQAGELVLTAELGPEARERYLHYEAGRLVTSEEMLSASWYVSSGRLTADQTSISGSRAQNRWQLDSAHDGAWLWLVVRDDRGAMAVETRSLDPDALP